MSAQVEDVGGTGSVSIAAEDDAVRVAVHRLLAVDVAVSRADFLAAVASELDVIVIERAANITVEPHSDEHVMVGGDVFSRSIAPVAANRMALRWALLAEYLVANPPVDPEQVKAVDEALRSLGDDWERGDLDLAHRLVERGVRVEVAS